MAAKRRRTGPRKGMAWINQVFQAGQVAQGNIVRRSMHSVSTYASPTLLERAVRAKGFHMALMGSQYVILCNTKGDIQIVC